MIEAIPFAFIVIAGFAYSLWSKDMLASVLGMAVAGLGATAFFFVLQAPDVAIAEAAVGAGLIPFVYFMALGKTKRFQE